jgi:hypothetical protein
MENLLNEYKKIEKTYLEKKQSFINKINEIIELWNKVYPNKSLYVGNMETVLVNIEKEELKIIETYYDRFDYENKKTFSIPMEFVNNIDFYQKNLENILKLFELRKELRSTEFDNEYKVYIFKGIKEKEIGNFDLELTKKSSLLGCQISQIIKNGGDASSLIEENKAISLKKKEFENIKKTEVENFVSEKMKDFLIENGKKIKFINEQIDSLEKEIGKEI